MSTCKACGGERIQIWEFHERAERAEGELSLARIEIEWLRRVAADKEAELTRMERSLAMLEGRRARASLVEQVLHYVSAWQRSARRLQLPGNHKPGH